MKEPDSVSKEKEKKFLTKEEMLELGKKIQENWEKIEQLVEKSPYLRQQVLRKRNEKQKEEKELFGNRKRSYYVLGIGDVELSNILNKYKVRYQKIKDSYNEFKEARQKLAMSCVKRVYGLSNFFKTTCCGKTDLEDEDLEYAGNVCLLESALLYDPSKNTKFNTWVDFRLGRAIKRYIQNKGRKIRIPVHFYKIGKEIEEAQNILKQSEKEASYENISKITGHPKKTIEDITRIFTATSVKQMDSYVLDDDGESGTNRLEDEKEETIINQASKNELQEKVKQAFKKSGLNKKEKDVLKRRFGFYNGIAQTLEEIGQAYHFSRERARQIEQEALKKLKNNEKVMNLLKACYDDFGTCEK